jgi:hypothetical protein
VKATAIGVGTVALVAVWFWWNASPDPSGCPLALARAAPSTVDEASSLIGACSAEEIEKGRHLWPPR